MKSVANLWSVVVDQERRVPAVAFLQCFDTVDEQEKEHQVCTKPAAVILTGSLATWEQRQKTKKN